jgi:serine/threonine-protein kinase RsbW/stage II sporulation protein AB (anti-sigma F factor)
VVGQRPKPSPVVLVLDAVPESVPVARHVVAGFAEECTEGEAEHVALATTEAVTNAVVHAYRDREPGSVRLCARLEGDDLVVAVRDEGVGLKPNPRSPGLGFGLTLIRTLTKTTRFSSREGKGLEVSMRFPCPAG